MPMTPGKHRAECLGGDEALVYVTDVDHDYGSCEVYKCSSCGKTIHAELPD